MIPLPNEQTQTKIQKHQSADEKILSATSEKMMRYLKREGRLNLEEIKNLLNGMERSIMCIQRRKKKLIEKKQQRKV